MSKTINLEKSVYEICTEYPEVKEVLAAVGFRDITKPGMLNTVGKFMTIPRGASMHGIDLSKVILALQAGGFEIGDARFGENIEGGGADAAPAHAPADDKEGRTALLRDYVARLSRGDSLEAVKKDFVAHFQSVDAAEIAQAEQELISGGTPISDVQKLCDVHSALFHGATREEKIANAEKAVQASAEGAGRASLSQLAGHPVSVFTAENGAISGLIEEIKACAASGSGSKAVMEKLNALRAVTQHYAEKGDLIYPVLKTKYGVAGPADVMWGVDDEIRDELKILAEAGDALPNFSERLDKLLSRAEEMVYKENNILLPICAQNFTEEDWMRIYYELPAYDNLFSGQRPVWRAAEERRGELNARRAAENGPVPGGGYIPLNSGHMTPAQIEAVLNTIPMELTFIDEGDTNRFFNAGTEKKLFKRPDEAVDREVYSCHPPKYAAMARQIITELKAGERDSVDVWLNKRGEPVLVRYMAVRDKNGGYVGTLECVQKMDFARKHFEAPAEQSRK
jgi:DUF438 domain-containing protein